MDELIGETFEKKFFDFFRGIALCEFGHWKRNQAITKSIIARSFKLCQLIEDDE